jgi:D-lyxose ketol-isomerase
VLDVIPISNYGYGSQWSLGVGFFTVRFVHVQKSKKLNPYFFFLFATHSKGSENYARITYRQILEGGKEGFQCSTIYQSRKEYSQDINDKQYLPNVSDSHDIHYYSPLSRYFHLGSDERELLAGRTL